MGKSNNRRGLKMNIFSQVIDTVLGYAEWLVESGWIWVGLVGIIILGIWLVVK